MSGMFPKFPVGFHIFITTKESKNGSMGQNIFITSGTATNYDATEMGRRFSDLDNKPTKKRANDECEHNVEWHEPPKNKKLLEKSHFISFEAEFWKEQLTFSPSFHK